MKLTIKELQRELRNEKQFKEEWMRKYYRIKGENTRMENWIKYKFDWWIELLSNGKNPCLKFLIKDTAEILWMK